MQDNLSTSNNDESFQDESESSNWQSDGSDTQSDSSDDEVLWDGSEAELIVDDDGEEYEEEQTGIKFKYTLSEDEIYEIFKSTDNYRKNNIMMRNQIIIQSIVILVLLVLWLCFGNTYCGFFIALPILCLGILAIVPVLAMKKLAKQFFSGEEIHTEIYPDKVVVQVRGKEHEIPLNGTSQYQELAGQIIIYPPDGGTVIIPVRAIEPEFLPDVQAMLVAGTHPREND